MERRDMGSVTNLRYHLVLTFVRQLVTIGVRGLRRLR